MNATGARNTTTSSTRAAISEYRLRRSLTGGGMRGYILFAGGLDVPSYLGSVSTFDLGEFGGHGGRRLRVERRVLPVSDDLERRRLVFERELWRIAVENLHWGEQLSVRLMDEALRELVLRAGAAAASDRSAATAMTTPAPRLRFPPVSSPLTRISTRSRTGRRRSLRTKTPRSGRSIFAPITPAGRMATR